MFELHVTYQYINFKSAGQEYKSTIKRYRYTFYNIEIERLNDLKELVSNINFI